MKKVLLSSLLLALSVAPSAFAQDVEDSFTVSYTAQASCEMTLEKDPSQIGSAQIRGMIPGHPLFTQTSSLNNLIIKCNKDLPYKLSHLAEQQYGSLYGRMMGVNTGS